MPRRREVAKRDILPDPKYNSKLVAKFVNKVMRRGKKSLAERILYGAFDLDRAALQAGSAGSFSQGHGQCSAHHRGEIQESWGFHLSGSGGSAYLNAAMLWPCAGSFPTAKQGRKRPWSKNWPASCRMQRKTADRPSRNGKTLIEWPRPTRPSHIIDGSDC